MNSRGAERPRLCGPRRKPWQMLFERVRDSHKSIHDDDTAAALGQGAVPIEGPTHFSPFAPRLCQLFRQGWFETGCIGAQYQNMVVEGDELRVLVQLPAPGESATGTWEEKRGRAS